MKATRLLHLIAALQRNSGRNAAELAQSLGVSQRTIFRDLQGLLAAGIPVQAQTGRGGGIRLPEGYRTQLALLSAQEAEAAALLGLPAAAGPFKADLSAALDKLSAALPAIHRERARQARQRLLFDAKPWFRQAAEPALLEGLRRAVWSDRLIRVLYQGRDAAPGWQRLAPHGLVLKVDAWYLVARKAQRMQVFRVARLAQVDVQEQGFTRQRGFDLQRFWSAWREQFEREPPHRYLVELEIDRAARQALLARHGDWLGSALAAASDSEPAVVTLDLQREDIAADVLAHAAAGIRIRSPESIKARLRRTAEALLEATR